MTPIPGMGETILLRPRSFDIEHLWVIVTEAADVGCAVMFNLTGWTMDNDHTCILKIGEHDFITKRTVVEYQRGILLTPEKWQHLLDTSDLLKPHKPVGKDLLKKIQKGALHEDGRTEEAFRDIVRQFLID